MEGITTNGASHGSSHGSSSSSSSSGGGGGDSRGTAKQKEGSEAAAGAAAGTGGSNMKDDSIIMKGDAGAKAKDFAEYFCSYAFLYHQVSDLDTWSENHPTLPPSIPPSCEGVPPLISSSPPSLPVETNAHGSPADVCISRGHQQECRGLQGEDCGGCRHGDGSSGCLECQGGGGPGASGGVYG